MKSFIAALLAGIASVASADEYTERAVQRALIERDQQSAEFAARLPPPVVTVPGKPQAPLPLPGGPRPGVDPVTPQSLGQ